MCSHFVNIRTFLSIRIQLPHFCASFPYICIGFALVFVSDCTKKPKMNFSTFRALWSKCAFTHAHIWPHRRLHTILGILDSSSQRTVRTHLFHCYIVAMSTIDIVDEVNHFITVRYTFIPAPCFQMEHK